MAEPDDASSALIAKLLQEDGGMLNPTYDGFGFDDFSSDEEEKRKRKRKRKGGRKSKPKTQKKSKPRPKKENDSGQTNKDGKPKEGKAYTPRKWTEEEETRFIEALGLYGRNWKMCAEHMQTRDAKSFRSHAQKYFIKLYRNNKPLPDKVKESGEGYTLSGKPLDPNSGAGRAYGALAPGDTGEYDPNSARATNDRLLAQARKDGSIDLSRQVLPGESRSANTKPVKPALTAEELEKQQQEIKRQKEEEEKERIRMKKLKKAEAWAKRQAAHEHLYDDDGMTSYSRNRSRRHVKKRFIDASNELSFVPCASYHGEPGSGEPLSQPFKVSVHSNVYALVDLHSHLSTAEVMGFLAGNWNPETKEIEVVAAYPGRSVLDGATECEMDPVTEVEVRSKIEGLGLKVVGWYHSHPTFQAIPSKCDVDNQCNYQALFRDASSKTDPFIGLIDSPFDVSSGNPTTDSRFAWFYVDSPTTSKKAMHIKTSSVADKSFPEELKTNLMNLVSSKDKASSKSVTFGDIWCDYPGFGPMSYKEKTKRALIKFIPEKEVEEILECSP